MLEQQLGRWLSNFESDRSIYECPTIPLVLATDKGRNRRDNQDRVAAMSVHTGGSAKNSFVCIALCDGMGGMSHGAEGATIALSCFLSEVLRLRKFPPGQRLSEAAFYANSIVNEQLRGKGGTTLSAIIMENNKVHSVNLGDSRIYAEVSEGNQHSLKRLTVDDNIAEAYGGTGNELVQFIGMGEGISPHVQALEYLPKSILITSDGAHFYSEDVLEKAYLNAKSQRQKVERILHLSDWLGSPDNSTVACFNSEFFSELPPRSSGVSVDFWNAQGAMTLIWTHNEAVGIPQSHNQQNRPEPQQEDSNTEPSEHLLNTKEDKPAPRVRKRTRKKKDTNEQDEGQQLEINISVSEGGSDSA